MNNVAFIFARGGSKGLPGKNIKLLNRKPLIQWSVEHVLATPSIRRLIVSTDDEEIAVVAKQAGAEVPFMRPKELARDESPEFLAWRHALEWLRIDEGQLPNAMVSVPATSPLRQPKDIENCIDVFNEGAVDVVVTVTDAHRNPWFNMVTIDSNGEVNLVNKPSEGIISRRQDTPLVYDLTTVAYVVQPQFVLEHESIFAGRVKSVYVPPERSIDIDNLFDFHIADFLMQQGVQRT